MTWFYIDEAKNVYICIIIFICNKENSKLFNEMKILL